MLDFIVDANLPFHTVNQPAFRDLCESLAGMKLPWPTRHKIMEALDKRHKATKQKLIDLLKQQEHLCVTADVWTSHAQSYLGVTVHFIDEDYKRQSFLLAFKQLIKRQTYDVLAKAMDDIFAEYQIDKSKITNIVTDGGSAFSKMFKQYGEQINAVVVDVHEISDEDSES